MIYKSGSREHHLEVPLDASAVEGFKPEKPVKVLLLNRKGPVQSAIVALDDKGHGSARFALPERSGNLRVLVGPADATDEELTGLQIVAADITARLWANQAELRLRPIVIPPYYWHWWLVWCREFVIRGRVLCPNGRPAPGAKVCAYDVDWWFWWSSTELLACDTTDINGAFEIKFTRCCGWWPWWWWRHRFWQLEPLLVDRIAPVLRRDPRLADLIRPKPQPALADFAALLGAEGAHLVGAKELDPAALASLREPLLKRLPPAVELEQLHIWPWWPWQPPWWDCNPDVIFKVTQDCAGTAGSTLIVNETIFDTRWNIPTTLNNVTLVAGDNACCIPDSNPCDGDCLALTTACGSGLDHIGGNIAAPAAPVGYLNPGAAGTYSDRPFAGAISITGTADCMDDVDYYELEWATNPGGPWSVMPPAANGAFARGYLQFVPFGFHYPGFPASPISGRNVYETLQHYESTHPPADWGGNRVWITNRDLLINWLTENSFADGTYWLRVRGWNVDAGGNLINPRILKICESDDEAFVVLRVDNRVVSAGPADLHGKPCGSGTVHACTEEPDSAIVNIQLLHQDGTTTDLIGCSSAQLAATDQMLIDFVAYDPDGHLAELALSLHYDVNLSTPLVGLGTLTSAPAWSGVPSAVQAAPNYPAALALGAVRPTWNGGVMRLTLSGANLQAAFPYTCCYQLRLDVYKRTLVNCAHLHFNISETSFTILV